MFPSAKTRFRSAAVRGLDFAVEFATLGEYRLPEPAATPTARTRGRRSRPLLPPRPTIAISRQAIRLAPATAAARRREAMSPVAIGAREAVRTMALSGEGAVNPRAPRARGGQPPTRPQPCVVAEDL